MIYFDLVLIAHIFNGDFSKSRYEPPAKVSPDQLQQPD